MSSTSFSSVSLLQKVQFNFDFIFFNDCKQLQYNVLVCIYFGFLEQLQQSEVCEDCLFLTLK